MDLKALKTGMVRGIMRKADQFEVAVALGADQWIITKVDSRSLERCKLAVGQPVLVDTRAQPFALRPWELRA